MAFDPDAFLKDEAKPKFDPDKFLQEPVKSSFDPDQFLATPNKQEETTIWGRNVIIPTEVKEDELQQIAKRHNVSSQELSDWVSIYGGLKSENSIKDVAKFLAAEAGEALALGLPQWFLKKTQDEKMRSALDELSDVVEEKKSWLQKGGELVGGIGSSLKLAKGATKALAPKLAESYIKVAAPTGAAVSGLAHSKEGSEVLSTAAGGAIGAGLAAIPGAAQFISKKLGPTGVVELSKTVEQQIEDLVTKNKDTIDLTARLLGKKDAIKNLSEAELLTFLKRTDVPPDAAGLTGLDILRTKATSKLARVENNLAKSKGYTTFAELAKDTAGESQERVLGEMLVDKVKDSMVRNVAKKGSPVRPLTLLERGLFSAMDARPVYNIIDSRLNLQLGTSIDKAAAKLNEANIVMDSLGTAAEKAINQIDSPELSKKIIQEIESGKPSSETAQLLNQAFSDARTAWNGLLGGKIRQRANYVPQMRKTLPEYQQTLAQRAKEIGMDTAKQLDIKNTATQELLTELSKFAGHPIKNLDQAKKALGTALMDDGTLFKRLDITAAGTKARDEALPAWIRDTNIASVWNRYNNAMAKEYALSGHLKNMQRAIDVAELNKDFKTADYLRSHFDDIAGTKGDVFQEWAKSVQNKAFKDSITKQISEAGTDNTKTFWQNVKESPAQVQRLLANQLYAAALAGPKPSLQNLATPYLNAFPELGITKATEYYGKALKDMAQTITQGTEIIVKPHMASILKVPAGSKILTHNPAVIARNEGIIGAGMHEMKIDPKQLEQQRSTLAKVLGTATQSVNDVALAMFNASEKANRGIILNMGKHMADDLRKNPDLLTTIIKAPGTQKEVYQMLRIGKVGPELDKVLAQYLNAHTALNYDKLAMSEFGRRVGPFFRQFTKYPSYAAGRGAQEFYTGTAKDAATNITFRYLSPMIALNMVDHAMDIENNPRYKKLAGSQGLTEWVTGASPITSAKAVATGKGMVDVSLPSNPLFGLVKNTLQLGGKVAREELEPAEAADLWLQKTYQSIGPGAGILKLIGDDLPTLIKNEATDTSVPFIERNIQRIKGAY